MSKIECKVGPYQIEFMTVPKGSEGNLTVRVNGKPIDLRFKRDTRGILIELPTGLHSFDLIQEVNTDDPGMRSYSISNRNGPEAWAQVRFLQSGESALASSSTTKKKSMRIRSQMPGKILRVLVKVGDKVEKNAPLLVMEAMKMENEILAQQSGTVKTISIAVNQAIESNAELLEIDPSS
jgi:biotin carboxyl carrier protein